MAQAARGQPQTRDVGIQATFPSQGRSYKWVWLGVCGVLLAFMWPLVLDCTMFAVDYFFGTHGFRVPQDIMEDLGLDGVLMFKRHDRDNDGLLSLQEFEPLGHRLLEIKVSLAGIPVSSHLPIPNWSPNSNLVQLNLSHIICLRAHWVRNSISPTEMGSKPQPNVVPVIVESDESYTSLKGPDQVGTTSRNWNSMTNFRMSDIELWNISEILEATMGQADRSPITVHADCTSRLIVDYLVGGQEMRNCSWQPLCIPLMRKKHPWTINSTGWLSFCSSATDPSFSLKPHVIKQWRV